MTAILKIDPQTYASQGGAILGIRDSGKSYTATKIAEQLFDAGIPFVAFDPIGLWRFLRVPGKGRGYPVIVAGGEDPDLPLTPTSAAAIMRAAMQNGVSLVIDLFDPRLSKADWKRIVQSCVSTLLFENKEFGLRHIFLEEAAEFVPQIIPKDGVTAEVYSVIERLARMGGNRRLGYTLINQRAEQVNKAVLELCDNLFLHRQKGKNSIGSLRKWLDVAGVSEASKITDSLPTLPQGQCWEWLAGETQARLVKVPTKNSFHPDRRAMSGSDTALPKRVDAAKFVAGLKVKLVEIEAEAKANDPKLLKDEIARLKKELAKNIPKNIPPDPQAIEKATRSGFDEGYKTGRHDGHRQGAHAQLNRVVQALAGAAMLNGDADALTAFKLADMEIGITPKSAPMRLARPSAPFRDAPKKRVGVQPGARIPPGELAVMIAAAQFGSVERDQLSVLTGYKRSSRDAYIQRLREKGYVSLDGSTISLTPEGEAALPPDYEPLPTGEALYDYWRNKLPEGEKRILEVLLKNFPEAVSRADLDEATGYKRSSRDAYLQRMKAKRLVVIEGASVRASDNLVGGEP